MGRAEGDGGRGKEERETEIKRNRGREEDRERAVLLVLKMEAAAAKLLQSCLTLCDSMDSSPPGSSVHGILQARILEWVAISFSRRWRKGPQSKE